VIATCEPPAWAARFEEEVLESLKREVRQFLKTRLDRDADGVSDSDSLLEAGIIDSMAVLELVGHIEQEYGLTVSDDDMMPDNFDTIDAIATFIATRRAGRA
jgi:acyl carrier protein